MAEKLTSAANEAVKTAVRVRDSARFRREHSLFFLEGARLCADAVHSGCTPAQVFYTPQALERYAGYLSAVLPAARRACEITAPVAAKLTDTKTPQGVFGVFEIPPNTGETEPSSGAYLALENIQDPGNLGAICRTAEALGVRGVVMSGCCDRYNPKAQRAAMGSLLRLNLIAAEDLTALLERCAARGFKTYASVPDAHVVKVMQADFSGDVLTVIGNEGSGITPQVQDVCTRRITIPMGGRAESLNANSAAAILIWEMMRGRVG